jgi:hypothetical protein
VDINTTAGKKIGGFRNEIIKTISSVYIILPSMHRRRQQIKGQY